jgi:adenylate cyclase
MAELVASGKGGAGWRRVLSDQAVTLGRLPEKCDWPASWDGQISRLHATIHWRNGKLYVRRLPDGKNAVWFRGGDAGFSEFEVPPGEFFVIGETTFQLEDPNAQPADDHDSAPLPNAEIACSADELKSVAFSDVPDRLQALAALPAVVRFGPNESLLEERVVKVLLSGILRADRAAVVRLIERPGQQPAVEVRTTESRGGRFGEFRPSRRLVIDAVQNRRQTVLQIWHAGASESALNFTADLGNSDWAMCAPLPVEPSPGWALYLTGRLPETLVSKPEGEAVLKGDLKFAELTADLFGALRQLCDLQRKMGEMSQTFSRPVLAALAGKDINEVLRPRQVKVTVLFADLRNACRVAEEGAADLMALWNRVSEALGLMTSAIIDEFGVVNDFQGDAVMGFWGWPTEQPDQIERAARAALAIQRRFQQAANKLGHPLAGLTTGIGIAHGDALAGRLGTVEQFKVDVFGPTVNLASRMENMTKHFGVHILADEECGRRLATIDPSGLWVRCRQLARIRPYGMERTLLVNEILPPALAGDSMTENNRRLYEAALTEFLAGHWDVARGMLAKLPPDGAGDFLQEFMTENRKGPPLRWDGVVPIKTKTK